MPYLSTLAHAAAKAYGFASFQQTGNFIPIPAATPAAFGDSFEGGFYTGLIWNQVTQSSTSTTIGTGFKTFTVTDDMAVTPLFYFGQSVEVRSRANPATNRMIGTIQSAIGTTLIVDVTSVDGSGTLTDWSIMAKYRMIMAPKSSGEASKLFKNASTAAPTESETLTEGKRSTEAMVADGDSTVYPAAHFCNDLTINGYSDWYLPARDELELGFRNLKARSNSNYTTANRALAVYTNLGSIGDTTQEHGRNLNSSPQGAAYTSSVPGQTGLTDFQSGGAEAFDTQRYWSSTQSPSTTGNAFLQIMEVSLTLGQFQLTKTNNYVVRAFRRSII